MVSFRKFSLCFFALFHKSNKLNFKCKMKLILFRKLFTILVIFGFLIVLVKCQDEEEEDDEYDDEEPSTKETPTTRKYRVRPSTTVDPPPSGRNESVTNGNSTALSAGSTSLSSSSNSNAAPASAPAPAPTRAPPPLPPTRSPIRATTLSESQEEETTEEEGLGYIFRPLTNLIDNVVAGNISGIVDNALSIRTPPEIRSFVNNVMQNVFGVGVGSALRQFAPNLFSTPSPPRPGRDPIPPSDNDIPIIEVKAPEEPKRNGPPVAEPVKATPQAVAIAHGNVSIIETRTNGTEETKEPKKEPIQLKFTHPGAPASRLKCEIIAD